MSKEIEIKAHKSRELNMAEACLPISALFFAFLDITLIRNIHDKYSGLKIENYIGGQTIILDEDKEKTNFILCPQLKMACKFNLFKIFEK